MNLPSTLVALIALGSLLMPRNADAQDANVLPIEWTDNPHCERPTTLDADIRRLLGPNTNAPTGTRFLIELSAENDRNNRDSHRLRLLLRVITPERPRQRLISVSNCAEAARTAAMLISVAIDPTVSAPVPTDAHSANDISSVQEAMEPAHVADATTPEPTTADATTDGTLSGFGASLGLDVGRLPKPSLDVTLRGVARAPHIRLELLASWLPTTVKDVPERRHASLDVWAASVATRICMLTGLSGLRIGPCALARVGVFHGDTSAVDRSSPRTTWLLGTGLAGVIEWPLSRQLAIDLIGGGELALLRPTFRVQGSAASHTPAALNAQVGLGLLAVFE